MHEFELGVLKNVLKHLIRILYVVDPSNVARLNERYVEHLRAIDISVLDLHNVDTWQYHHLGLMAYADFLRTPWR